MPIRLHKPEVEYLRRKHLRNTLAHFLLIQPLLFNLLQIRQLRGMLDELHRQYTGRREVLVNPRDIDGVPNDGIGRVQDEAPYRLRVLRFVVKLGFLLLVKFMRRCQLRKKLAPELKGVIETNHELIGYIVSCEC